MRKILLFLGVLILTLSLTVGIGNATLHTIIDANSIEYVDEGGVSIFKIDDDDGVSITGAISGANDILMVTTKQVQFCDTGLYIGATANGALAISSDGTLAVGAITSYTLTSPTTSVVATTSITVTSPSLTHKLDATNFVTQTIGATGLVTVTTTGAGAGSYKIVADDTTIILDAATSISLEAGASTYSLSATALTLPTGTDLVVTQGSLDLSNAGTGTTYIKLNDNVADALSIVRDSTDMILFKTSATPLITITPAVTITGLLTANGGIYVGNATTGILLDGTFTTGLQVTGTLGVVAARAIKSNTTINNCNLTDGYGTNEFDLTITGTGAGHIATTSTWLNIGSGSHGSGGSWLTPLTVGVWEASAATITGASVTFGMHMQAILGDTDAARLCPFSLNVSGDTIDAVFNSASMNYLAYSADAGTSDTKFGGIPFAIDSNGEVYWIRLYEGPG